MDNEQYMKDFSLAMHYMGLGQLDRAIEVLQELLEKDPEDSEVLFLLATCYYHLDELIEARELAEAALAKGWWEEEAKLLLAKIAQEMGEFPEAETLLLDVLRLDPENAEATARYAYLMLICGFEEKAEKLLAEALAKGAEDEEVMRVNYMFYVARGGRGVPEEMVVNMLSYESSELRQLLNLGLAELSRENLSGARDYFRQAIALEPSDENLRELVQELEQDSHPLLAPLHWLSKIGGAWVLWLLGPGLSLLLLYLGYRQPALVVMGIYAAIIVYSWIAPVLVKVLSKRG